MAKTSNLFTLLSLNPDIEGENEGEDDERAKQSFMPSSKQQPSRRKRGKPKIEIAETLQLSTLSIREESQHPRAEAPSVSSLLRESSIPPLSSNSLIDRVSLPDSLKLPLVWIDLEMTGLDLDKDRILEIACVITDGKLHKVLEGPDLIIHQSEQLLAGMGEWCQTHHKANGLIEAVRKSELTEKEAEEKVLEFVCSHVGTETKQPLLAGNSVYVDLMFLRRYMPRLAGLFPHVVVDVSSVKALCLRWFPKDAERAPAKKKSHRAMDDIMESLAELKYMQKAIFKESKK